MSWRDCPVLGCADAPPGLAPKRPRPAGAALRGLRAARGPGGLLRGLGRSPLLGEGESHLFRRQGALRGHYGGIPKQWAPGRLRSGPKVPTVTPPPRLWGWGRDWSRPLGGGSPDPRWATAQRLLASRAPQSDTRQPSSPHAVALKRCPLTPPPSSPPQLSRGAPPAARPLRARIPAAGPPCCAHPQGAAALGECPPGTRAAPRGLRSRPLAPGQPARRSPA